MRVARPRRTSSSPVANGSSVPAWPTFTPWPRRAGRRDDVVRRHAGGLVDQQDAVGGSELLGEARRRNATSSGQSIVGREARGAAVPAAALRARDQRDVDPIVGGAQRHLARCRRAGELVADEAGDRGPLDRAQVVDHALGVGLLGAGRLVVLGDRWVSVSRPPSKRCTFARPRASRSSLASGTLSYSGGRSPARRRRPRAAPPPSGARAGRCSRT